MYPAKPTFFPKSIVVERLGMRFAAIGVADLQISSSSATLEPVKGALLVVDINGTLMSAPIEDIEFLGLNLKDPSDG